MSLLLEATRVAQKELRRKSEADRYFNDPVAWADYMLGAKMWSKQREMSDAVVTEHDVAVKAAHSTGKSWWVALLTCWWIDTRYVRVNSLGEPDVFVASTAPSEKQIGAIVWDYIKKFKSAITRRHKEGVIDHELPGYITADNQWKTEKGYLLGFGRKPPENMADSSFQGVHRRYVLAIGDEGVGLSLEMIDALANITTGPDCRRILIANPTNPSSPLGKIFKENGQGVWRLFTISAFDSPNFKDDREGLPEDVTRDLVDARYVEQKKREYGEDSARYKARVLGEFAWDLGDTLITPEDLAIAHDTEITPLESDPVWLGVDISRYGADRSTVYSCTGGKVRFIKAFDQNSLVQLAAETHRIALDLGATEVRYDVQGVGQGFEELLMQHEPRPYKMIGLAGSGASPDQRQWHNARAYWWDTVRKMLRAGSLDLDPRDETLSDEIVMVGYKFGPKGGLLIESKDEMRKRGMKSPDFADAMVYASVDLDEMLQPKAKNDRILEDSSDILGDSLPSWYDLLVQGW